MHFFLPLPQRHTPSLKIALLAHLKHPITQPFAGGLEMHTHLLTGALRARGHAVTLFCAVGSDPALDPIEICPPTGEGGGHPAREEAIDEAEFLAYSRIMDAVMSGGYDLVHNNSLHDLPLRRSGHLAAPMLSVLHTPPFEPLAAGVRSAASGLAAVSRTVASLWREIVPDLRVIGNGIDLSTFPFQPVTDRPSSAFWSGRIVPEKGLHLAIDATRMAGLPLAFAGPRHDAAYWAREIEPRLGPDLRDLGHLSQPELAVHLGGARVAVVTPRWEEPFGLVVAEALACGTPVAGFRRGALPEILDASSGCLARADDVAGLARAIGEAGRCDRRACRSRAEALFDAAVMTDRYEALYREMLAGAHGRVPASYDLDAAEA